VSLATVVVLLCAVSALVAIGLTRAARGQRRSHASDVTRDLPGAVLVFDRRLRHVQAYGRDVTAVAGSPTGLMLHESFDPDVVAVFEPAYRAARDGEETRIELPLAGRDWLITVAPATRERGVLVATDVTERKRRERRLTELASSDPLTGLWNRRRFDEELDWLVQGGRAGTLLVLDLDGFKHVNDRLGHDAGDELLRTVARAVSGCVRRADLVARNGGDEFAVLLVGATPEEAGRVADKIRAAVAAVWPLGLSGGVSIGTASVGGSAGDVVARADRAMYASKLRRAS
jgi:diguanylate cyclase (GGDEF)-like protein